MISVQTLILSIANVQINTNYKYDNKFLNCLYIYELLWLSISQFDSGWKKFVNVCPGCWL